MRLLGKILERYLGIRKQEQPRAVLMLGYFFFLTAAGNFVETVSSTLFLSRFSEANVFGFQGIKALPLLWILSGLIFVPLVSLIRDTFAAGMGLFHEISLSKLIHGTTIFLACFVLGFWLLFFFHSRTTSPWLIYAFPGFVIGAELFANFILLNMETAFNRLFNIREAKRVSGFIGGGAVLADILAGFCVGVLLLFLSIESLIFVIVGLLVLSLGLFAYLVRSYPHAFLTSGETDEETDRQTSEFVLWKSKYVLLIAGAVLLSQMTFFFVDYQFQSVAQAHFVGHEEDLASFFGVFFGSLGILQLILQLFCMNFVYRRFGIFAALLMLPLGIGGFSPWTAVALFSLFGMSCILKGHDTTFRGTFLLSTMPLLYQTLPSGIASRAQGFISGKIEPMSIGFSSLVLILLTSTVITGKNIYMLGWGLLIIASGWVAIILLLKNSYLKTLLFFAGKEGTHLGGLELNNPEILKQLYPYLEGPDAPQVTFCVNLLDKAKPPDFYQQVERLLDHPSLDVQALAMEKLAQIPQDQAISETLVAAVHARFPRPEQGDNPLEPAMIRLQANAIRAYGALHSGEVVQEISQLLKNPNREIRGAALATMISCGGIDGILTVGPLLKEMLTHPSTEERIEVCRQLGESRANTLYQPLLDLMRDADPGVRREAIVAAGKICNPRLIPTLIDTLDDVEMHRTALDAVVHFPHEVPVALLSKRLLNPHAPVLSREIAARVLGHFDVPESIEALLEAVTRPHDTIRSEGLRSLVRLIYQGRLYDTAPIVQVLDEEILAYFFTLRLLAKVSTEQETVLFRSALRGRLEDIKSRITLCAKLLYPRSIIEKAELHLSSSLSHVRAKGLEMLDGILSDAHKLHILMIFDELEEAQKLEYAQQALGGQDAPLADFFAKLFYKSAQELTPWIRVVSMRTAETFGITVSPWTLEQIICSQEAEIVQEEAMHTLHKIEPDHLRSILKTMIFSSDSLLESVANYYLTGEGSMLSTLDKVMFLKSVPIFSDIYDEHLVHIALKTRQAFFKAHSRIFSQGDVGDYLYIIVSGKVLVHIGGKRLTELGEKACFGEMAVLDAEPRSADVTAIEDAELLKLSQKDLLEAMALDVEVSRGIIKTLSQTLRLRTQMALS